MMLIERTKKSWRGSEIFATCFPPSSSYAYSAIILAQLDREWLELEL